MTNKENIMADENTVFKMLTEFFNDDKVDLNHFIVDNKDNIKLALRAGHKPLYIFMEEEYKNDEIIKDIVAANKDVEIVITTNELREQIVLETWNLQRFFDVERKHIKRLGIRCYFSRKIEDSFDEILNKSKRLLIVNNVTKAVNIGNLCINAYAFDIDAVIFTTDCTSPFARKAINYGNGNVFNINYCFIDSLDNQAIKKLKVNDFTTIAMALRKETLDVKDPLLKTFDKTAIVVGNEVEGLDESIIDALDYTVKIPMYNGVDSLNVSTAATIVLWEITKRDRHGK